jgi:hypothetical protein
MEGGLIGPPFLLGRFPGAAVPAVVSSAALIREDGWLTRSTI